MAYSNSDILAAVLTKWAQPAIQSIAGAKLMQLPMFANIEAKIKSTGWVSPMWSLGREVAPLIGGLGEQLVQPFLADYLRRIPDGAIPSMAHSLVDNALKQGNISLLEGNIIFERSDLEELQKLLRYNLPIPEVINYNVKENEYDTN
jgi:hypothetical protein